MNQLQSQKDEPIQSKSSPKEERNKARFTELLQVIKSTPMSTHLTLNSYVDVFDNYNSWRNGYILDVTKSDEVKIRFDGWSSKYDEVHKTTSTKVALFRSHADPYTGASRSAIRDFKFDRGVDRINRSIEKMSQMTISEFTNLKPSEICQFLRGELYILIDSVLQEQDPFRDDELRTSLDFIEAFLRFIVSWLKHLTTTEVIVDYIDGKNTHSDTYYYDANVGIVSCFPEFFDTLLSIFYGSQQRTKKFFQNNEMALGKISPTDGIFAASPRDRNVQNIAVLSFVNYFGQIGGYDRLADLFSWSFVENEKVRHRIPFIIMKSALPVIEAVAKIMQQAYREEYLTKLKSIIFDRLQNLTSNDLKDSQIKNLFIVLKLVPKSLTQLAKIHQESEQLEVRLALTFIRSGILEKKIRGVKELTDLIEKTTKTFMYNVRSDDYKVSYFNEASLASFFADERVFETLLNEASHPEVFKRTTPIMKFMTEQNGMSPEQLETLWHAQQNKHENESKAVLDTIAELAKVLPIETLDTIYEKILKVELQEYDSYFLMFIKDFTLNAVLNVQNQINKNQRFFNKAKPVQTKYEVFGVPLMWELIQDTSLLPAQLMSPAIMSFINCIKGTNLKGEREKYIYKCIENVQRGQSVPQSLLVAQHAIESFGAGQIWRGDAAEDQLSKISKELNLIDVVVTDLVGYVRKFAGTPITDPSTQVLQGKIAHEHHIRYRLEFIEYVNSVLPKKLELTLDSFRKLWRCLILEPLHEGDKQHLLDLLIKSSSLGQKSSLIRDSQIEEIFKTIFCDIALMPLLTPQLFKSIEKYFLYFNQKNQSLNAQKNTLKIAKFDNVVGVDFFWAVVQYCSKEEILVSARQTLVNLHLRTEKIGQVDQRLAMWQSFLTRCKDILRSPQCDAVGKGNVIRCLKLLIKGVEGKVYLTGTEPAKAIVKFSVQVGKNETTMKWLTLASNYTLLEMRKHINREFNLGIQDYELFFANYDVRLAPESEEDYAISQIEESRDREKVDIIIQNLSSSPYPGLLAVQKFKAQLANNWDIAEILFELLQSANEVYFEDIWEVLKLLPQNKVIKSQIEKLSTDGTEDSWNRILHFNCSRKLLYCLQIVETIIAERKGKEGEKWKLDFLKSKGVLHLMSYYSRLDNSSLSVIFNLKCFATLARVQKLFIESFFGQQNINHFDFLQKGSIELMTDVVNKSLNYILLFFTQSENKQYKESGTITDFIQSLMELVQSIITQQPQIWQAIASKDIFAKLIQKGIIDFQDQPARKALQMQLILLCKSSVDAKKKSINSYLLQIVANIFDKQLILDLKNQINEFLQLLSELILLEKDQHVSVEFIPQVIEIVFNCSSNEYESVIGQCFQVLKTAAQVSAEAKQLVVSRKDLAHCVIAECLFQLPRLDGANVVVARCQSEEARKEGYELAVQMLPGSLDTLLQMLDQYIAQAFWRSNSYQDWNIMQVSQQKSRSEFVGLKNLGCICYMNSLMQQLYTLPNFRDSIMQVTLEPKPSSVLYQFQLLLSALRSSQKQYYDPRPLCNVLGPECSPINVMEQMDVDEFWSGFMDKIEIELKPMRKELIIKRNFGGLLSNELICKGCPHQSSREELFLALPLQVKNKKNITESLQTMTEGEMLEGDNAYFCEKCEKKIPTLMRVCVKKLPNVLLLVLKRFEFNYETLTKSKLNDLCEFPMKLDMRPYTREYLKAQELNTQDGGDPSDEAAAPIDLPEYPPEYYEYQLRGVIIHQGTADSGHYYSLIKDGNTQHWFEFNDTIVRPFDINDLSAEAFGTDEKRSNGQSQQQQGYNGMARDRSRNAYMVFYERVVYVDDNGKPLRNDNELNWFFNKVGENEQEMNVDNAQWFNQEILQDNIKFQVNKVMFEKSFFDFSYNLLEYAEANPLSPHSTQIVRYCVQFFMTVVIRANERKELPKFVIPLKRLIKRSLPVSISIVEAFCNKDIVGEFLIHSPVTDMKYIIAGLLSTAINCVAQNIDKLASYQQFKKESPTAKLIVAFLQYFWDFRTESRKCDQFFRVLHCVCVSSANAKFFLLRHKTVGRILLYLLEEPPEGAGYQDLQKSITLMDQSLAILNPLKKVELTQSLVAKPNNLIANTQAQSISTWDLNQNNYTYLVETLSELFYGIGVNKGAENDKLQQGVVNSKTYVHALDDDELALLEDPQIMARLLSISYTRKARRALASLVQLIIKTPLDDNNFDPWGTTQRVVTSVYLHLKDCDEREVKAGLSCLGSIAAVKDAYEEQRCLLVGEVLLLTLKDGLNYWIYTEIVLDYLFKVCAQNSKLMQAVNQVLQNNKSVLKLIENWIKESQNPYNHFSQMRWKVFRKKSPQISSSEITSNLKHFQSKAQFRHEQLFKKIMKLEQPDQYSYDSDEELTPIQLEKGNCVDAIYPVRNSHSLAYDYTGYLTWEIMENIDDMIELRSMPDETGKQPQPIVEIVDSTTNKRWLHFDDDSLAPAQQAVLRHRYHVNFVK